MLNHQLILTDSEGRLRCTLLPPDPLNFNGGTPVQDGLLCIEYIDGEVYVNGLSYTLQGVITADQEASPSTNGNPFVSDSGRLRSSVGGIPSVWLYGLPFDENGNMCIVLDEPPPVDTRAFSSAFSNAFD
jgi:hypothetical protein